ncbi:MAG: hypothetical protein JO122_12080 [Acetobacteraceae bacterium]|nr:hypothetical protein [Acetobacteraceae bacterium]
MPLSRSDSTLRPLLGVRPVIEGLGLRREARASDLHSPELAALLDGSPDAPPALSQNAFWGDHSENNSDPGSFEDGEGAPKMG